MRLIKLTIADNGPEKGSSIYINIDKICGFVPTICRAGIDGYGKEKGSSILLETGLVYSVEENVKDICDLLENVTGYLQITSMPKKDQHES